MENKKTFKSTLTKIAVVLVLLIAVAIYHFAVVNSLKRNQEEQTTILKENFTLTMDSVQRNGAVELSKVFSWSVRSELLRENKEQVSQLFMVFVKNKSIAKLRLLEPETGKVMISTDMKDANSIVEINPNESMMVINTNNEIWIPITGINNQLGLLLIDLNINL